ncbi:hypothetical protein DPMN_094765 [Dreissena polymorpha]|uniref:Uncharacterized protein n=1 Tax=Dreissena polymorpha TaxID=45954 RepID=A0A9D4L5A6_DREPO|nr:hypothetical protein DPMN_094765 [Dreissena polymorpha]
MNKRPHSSTASESALTDDSRLEPPVFETPVASKQNKRHNKKKKTDKAISNLKSLTDFMTSKETEMPADQSQSSIEKRLQEISSKLSNVLTKDDNLIIKKIIRETLEELKEKLLGSVM